MSKNPITMAEVIQSKTCSKCGIERPMSMFFADKRRAGRQSQCKECSRAKSAAYYQSNKDRIKAASAAWYAANADKASEVGAAWRAANVDRKKANDAAWQLANPEKRRAICTAWQKSHPEAGRITAQNRRAKKRENGGKLSKGLAAKLFALQKGICPCCKQPLGQDFQLDHKMPIALGGANADDNMQLLRKTCNKQKSAKHPVDFMQSRGFLL